MLGRTTRSRSGNNPSPRGGTGAGAGVPVSFPGAVGFARHASGGRGGEVYRVTNTAASGAGSLHDAINSSHPDRPRIIVFATGGTCSTLSHIYTGKGNLTIAGETAPGGGFCVRGDLRFNGATNVVIRHLRFRADPLDAVLKWCLLFDGSQNVVRDVLIDHCTFSWSTDEMLAFWLARRVTVQNCLFHEWCRKYTATADAGKSALFFDDCQDVTIYRNVMAHVPHRAPLISGARYQVHENIVYNTKMMAGMPLADIAGKQQKDTTAEWCNNLILAGPAVETHWPSGQTIEWLQIANGLDYAASTGANYLHVSGNRGDNNRSNGTLDLVAARVDGTYTSVDAAWSGTDRSWPVIAPTTVDASWLSSRLADCYPVQGPDAAEQRIIDGITARATDTSATTSYLGVAGWSTLYPLDPASVGGYPTLSAGSAPTDTDGDGLPDSWENARGLDPHVSADAASAATASGYTQLDVYLHALADA